MRMRKEKEKKKSEDFWLHQYQELRDEYIDKYTDATIERDMRKSKAKCYAFWLAFRIIATIL